MSLVLSFSLSDTNKGTLYSIFLSISYTCTFSLQLFRELSMSVLDLVHFSHFSFCRNCFSSFLYFFLHQDFMSLDPTYLPQEFLKVPILHLDNINSKIIQFLIPNILVFFSSSTISSLLLRIRARISDTLVLSSTF